jgi:hypothetical protein
VLWGTDDDILGSLNIAADYEQALNDRGVTTMTLQGLDHLGAILGLGDVLEDVSRWLLATPTT